MKILKLSLFVFPLLISNPIMAQDDIDEDITNPGTGTFPLSENYSHPQQNMQEDTEQLEMEREEAELDGFGEDTYNENVDPDVYKVDEDLK